MEHSEAVELDFFFLPVGPCSRGRGGCHLTGGFILWLFKEAQGGDQEENIPQREIGASQFCETKTVRRPDNILVLEG